MSDGIDRRINSGKLCWHSILRYVNLNYRQEIKTDIMKIEFTCTFTWRRTTDKNQCCRAAIFIGGSGSRWRRSRSRLRLRLNWVGSGSGSSSRQKKRLQAAPAPYTKIFPFELLKSELLLQLYFGPYLPF